LFFLETCFFVDAGVLGAVTTTGGSTEAEFEPDFSFAKGGCGFGAASWPKAGTDDTSDRTAATDIRFFITPKIPQTMQHINHII
jgi:hypothetical protein